ncbi:hypothetical protein [Streptomyces sp. TLI_053]|uniref:hypothetical protein n=1 Tax=Streptomyces sp. TLI_053 TaxID=1855352 RepID=UPI001352074F|nr:hypothetical protein [Streptomyces sp. TLI_053]
MVRITATAGGTSNWTRAMAVGAFQVEVDVCRVPGRAWTVPATAGAPPGAVVLGGR